MRLALLVAAALAIGAGGDATPLPSPAHVVVIMFENKDSSQINVQTAPTFDSFGTRYARLTSYYGIAHPSLPNYLALVSGSTHGITNDCTTCSATGETLGDQLASAGRSWNAFAEDYPRGARFAKRHVPFLYFAHDRTQVLPLSRFDPKKLPTFAFVVPNLCNDMHDCSIATGDAWLKQFVQPLLTLRRTVVFLIFDEGTRTKTNHVAAFALGTAVRRHSRFDGRVDHYGLLRTIEEMYRLPLLGQAATATTITGIWR